MVTFFFDIADVIKNQYLAYEICINYMTKVIIMSGSEIFWGGFTLLSPTAIGCLRHTRRKTKSKLKFEGKKFFFKKEVLQDQSLFGKIA